MNLSLLAAVLSIAATFPQLYKTVQSGLLRDHHPITPIVAVLANILLAAHGYQKKDMGVFVFGLWFVLFNSVLVYYKFTPPPLERDD